MASANKTADAQFKIPTSLFRNPQLDYNEDDIYLEFGDNQNQHFTVINNLERTSITFLLSNVTFKLLGYIFR